MNTNDIRVSAVWVVLLALGLERPTHAQNPTLIRHWPLRGNSKESTNGSSAIMTRAVDFSVPGPSGAGESAARFNGRDSVIEIGGAETLRLGVEPFSISMWLNTDSITDDVPGDLINQYEPTSRTGFHIGLYTHGGVTNAQSNSKQLHFGIDQGRIEPEFRDHGQLGNAVYVFSLCVHAGRLYASTCHAGPNESGKVFRFEGGNRWTDLGSPDQANAISAMTVFNGSLYVASSKYRLAGSALAESQNPHFGGKVYRLAEGDQWEYCGTLSAETEAVAGLIVFKGDLYAGSLYRPAGFFRYAGGQKWISCETPGKRVEAITAFNGAIYATCYDEGSVFRFDGDKWAHVGKIPEATQTYGFAIHRGSLYVSEWPNAHVYRYLGESNWKDTGRLGDELETMPLLVYNGKMYGGTLPSAGVFRYDADMNWALIGRVDHTPDVKYRRAWSMAVYQGRLFVGALPSGRVKSIEAGRNVTYDHELSAGWHHVAASRGTNRLQLYVDGKQVAESASFESSAYDLSNREPIRIGFGAQDYFRGDLADIRLYRGALSPSQVSELSAKR